MTTELVHAGDGTTFLPTEHTAGRVWGLAQRIAHTDFVPSGLRGKPEAILACMLTAREVGIGAMHGLRAIDVIDGKPSLSAELMLSLVLREGHELTVIEQDREHATVRVVRKEWRERNPNAEGFDLTFDEVDARIAGLVGQNCSPAEGKHDVRKVTKNGRNGTYTKDECGCKQGYVTYPRAMYRARAIAEACRAWLPDVVERTGYTTEELGGDLRPEDRKWAEDATTEAEVEAQRDGDVIDAEVVEPDDEDSPEPEAEAAPEAEPEVEVVDPDEVRTLTANEKRAGRFAAVIARMRAIDEGRAGIAEAFIVDTLGLSDPADPESWAKAVKDASARKVDGLLAQMEVKATDAEGEAQRAQEDAGASEPEGAGEAKDPEPSEPEATPDEPLDPEAARLTVMALLTAIQKADPAQHAGAMESAQEVLDGGAIDDPAAWAWTTAEARAKVVADLTAWRDAVAG